MNVLHQQLFTLYRLGKELTTQVALDIRALCAVIADLDTTDVLTAVFVQLDSITTSMVHMVLALCVLQVSFGCYPL